MTNGEKLAIAAGLIVLAFARASRAQTSQDTDDRRPPILPDSEWIPAILTEYHPDAPPEFVKMEGGPNDRKGMPIITVQQHESDRDRYPFVSVASDTRLRGANVPYGTRLYLGIYPDIVFRIVDTGGRFRGEKKRYRKPGHEPFDIATAWGSKLGFSLKSTVYRIDRADNLTSLLPANKRK
jgi:hypothetical protein